MKLRDLQEQGIEGEYIPAAETDAEEMEEQLNQGLLKFGKSDELWASVYPSTGDIEVYIKGDDVIPIATVNGIARYIRDTAMAELVGISGGTVDVFYLHFRK